MASISIAPQKHDPRSILDISDPPLAVHPTLTSGRLFGRCKRHLPRLASVYASTPTRDAPSMLVSDEPDVANIVPAARILCALNGADFKPGYFKQKSISLPLNV
jgi:hypothetical protein